MSELPDGWAQGSLQELVGIGGLTTDGDWIESKDQDPLGEVRLIQLMDIGDGEFKDRSERYLTHETAERLNCTFLQQDDILIARMPDPIGRACLFPHIGQDAVTAVDVLIWRAGKDAALPRLIMHFVNSPEIRKHIASQAGGTTRQRIAGGRLKEMELPLPPLAEQRRIVAKLDSLFARTKTARDELNRIPLLVERYKREVLSKAFSGELTQDWRERRESSKMATATLADVCISVTDGDHQPPPKAERGIPFITIAAMNTGEICLEKATRFVPESYYDSLNEERKARSGDILFSVTGSIGIPAPVINDSKFVFQRHIAILRPDPKLLPVRSFLRRFVRNEAKPRIYL